MTKATPDQLRKAAALIGGADWDTALKRFQPKDEAMMTPLVAAIAHGCAAEQEAEAWSEVHWPRIHRGNEDFALKNLGLYGQELAALAAFFETPFTKPNPRLSRPSTGAKLRRKVLACARPPGGRRRTNARSRRDKQSLRDLGQCILRR